MINELINFCERKYGFTPTAIKISTRNQRVWFSEREKGFSTGKEAIQKACCTFKEIEND